MTGALEAIERLGREQQNQARSLLAFPVDVERACEKLRQVSREFAQKASAPPKLKPPLDPDVVWNDWKAHRFDIKFLDSRRIRALCVSPGTATRTELIDALSNRPAFLQRTSCLTGLIFAYFAKWGEIENQSALERVITTALQAYGRKNGLILHYREDMGVLFSSTVAERVGALAAQQLNSPKAILSEWKIGLSSNLGASILAAAARHLGALTRPWSLEEALRRLKFAFQEILVDELPRADFRMVISGLIANPWIETFHDGQDQLRQFVLRHHDLGDPRLQANNWAGMTKEAAEAFLRWIARDSIVFFFNHVLPDSSADHRRKDFWLGYANRIKDFQVALSYRDHSRLRSRSQLADLAGFARVDHDSTSAFIMKFQGNGGDDVIVVEFSENGNAAHAFNAAYFVQRAGSVRSSKFVFHKLKLPKNEHRILHQRDWEVNARNLLANWGVRP